MSLQHITYCDIITSCYSWYHIIIYMLSYYNHIELHCYYTITLLYSHVISSWLYLHDNHMLLQHHVINTLQYIITLWNYILSIGLGLGDWLGSCYMDGLKDTIGGDYKNKYITIALWALVLIFSAAHNYRSMSLKLETSL